MALITIKNLTFHYDGSYDYVFENASFSIDTDWKLGFIGRNGRGKTTLLKLLMGKYPYSGSISSSVEFDYFPFEIEDDTELAADIAERVSGVDERWKLLREINLLEMDESVLYRPFCTLSGGEKTRILLAALFLKEGNFLLIDEPTNHLDMEARRAVAKYLNGKRGFILVSHDRAFLDECIDHVLSINRATIEVMKGNYSSWQREKDRRDNYEISENARLTSEIERLREAARRTASWSDRLESTKIGSGAGDRGYIGAKSAKMMRHSKAQQSRINREIEKKEGLLHDVEYDEKLKLHPEEYFKETLIHASELALYYNGRQICNGIDFTLKRGERIALIGSNGCGKSSVLKLILGQDIDHTGVLNLGSRLKISYVPQDMSFLKGSLDAFANECEIDMTLFKTILRKLDFKRVQFEKDMSELSMGQKKKVLIARSLCEQAHLYIWDEPLNYVDVISRLQIEALILEYRPTMLFVEHDRAFVSEIATRSIELQGR